MSDKVPQELPALDHGSCGGTNTAPASPTESTASRCSSWSSAVGGIVKMGKEKQTTKKGTTKLQIINTTRKKNEKRAASRKKAYAAYEEHKAAEKKKAAEAAEAARKTEAAQAAEDSHCPSCSSVSDDSDTLLVCVEAKRSRKSIKKENKKRKATKQTKNRKRAEYRIKAAGAAKALAAAPSRDETMGKPCAAVVPVSPVKSCTAASPKASGSPHASNSVISRSSEPRLGKITAEEADQSHSPSCSPAADESNNFILCVEAKVSRKRMRKKNKEQQVKITTKNRKRAACRIKAASVAKALALASSRDETFGEPCAAVAPASVVVSTAASPTASGSPFHSNSGSKNSSPEPRWGNMSTEVSLEERSRRSQVLANVRLPDGYDPAQGVKTRPAPFPSAAEMSELYDGEFGMDGEYGDNDDELPPPSAYEVEETAIMMRVYQDVMDRLETSGFDKPLPDGRIPKIYDLT